MLRGTSVCDQNLHLLFLTFTHSPAEAPAGIRISRPITKQHVNLFDISFSFRLINESTKAVVVNGRYRCRCLLLMYADIGPLNWGEAWPVERSRLSVRRQPSAPASGSARLSSSTDISSQYINSSFSWASSSSCSSSTSRISSSAGQSSTSCTARSPEPPPGGTLPPGAEGLGPRLSLSRR